MSHTPFLLGGIGWAERRPYETCLRIVPGCRCARSWSSASPAERTRTTRGLSRLAAEVPAGVPAADFWSYTNVGWCVLGRVIETATDARLGSRHATPTVRQDRMSGTTFATILCEAARLGTRDHAGRPGAGRAIGLARVRTSRYERRLDGHGSAAIRGVAPAGPVARGVTRRAVGGLDLRLARFVVSRMGSVRLGGCQVWGWDGLIGGERSVLRIVPEHQAAIVLMTNGSKGRAMYRSLFADLMRSLFGISRAAAAPGPVTRCRWRPLALRRRLCMAGSAGRGRGHRARSAHPE